jgi:O-methyltransferase
MENGKLCSTSDSYIELLKDCLTASLYDESAWWLIEGSRSAEERTLRHPFRFLSGLIRHWVVNFCRRRSLLLVRERPFEPAMRAEGRDWPCFGYTMVGRQRLDNVQTCIEDILRNNVPGDLIETGAWRGGTAIFMRAVLKIHRVTDRTVWVADSFEGLPPPASDTDGADLSELKYLKVPLKKVKANFERFNLLDDQVKFLPGYFCDTLPNAPIERLAILRLDGDLYSSTMDSLRNLYHRVSLGGYVIVDDYYSWDSCRQAVTDFLRENQIDAQIRAIADGAYWKVGGS